MEPGGSKIFRTNELCRECHVCQEVEARVEYYSESNRAMRATCTNPRCKAPRALDLSVYGPHFGISVTARRRARNHPSGAASERVDRIADGACVHCIIKSEGRRVRFVDVPEVTAPSASPTQVTLFQDLAWSSTDDHARRISERDHLIPVAVCDKIEGQISTIQSDHARRIWIVPACSACNNLRKQQLEEYWYLMRAFSYFLEAFDIDVKEQVVHTLLFSDAVKVAHYQLRADREYAKRIVAD